MRAYLDIETAFDRSISVIGIYRPGLGTTQLVGEGVRDMALSAALEGVTTLVTFNGTSFDLPVIRRSMYVDLRNEFEHCDLMYICRRRGLRGGLKRIEMALGIGRLTTGISGWDAPRLWERYKTIGDRDALRTLLDYNHEDVINLAVLEDKIGMVQHIDPCHDVRHIFA